MEQFTDQAVVEEVLAGSRMAFDELMRRYEKMVYRVSYSYTRQQEDAMDVTQDVFLKVYAKLKTYRGSGAFKSWLLRVAHRENMNWLRSHRRRREADDPVSDTLLGAPPTQDTGLLRREQQEQIASALTELNPKQRLAVALRYYEDLPVRDIAAVLKCSEGNARSTLFRSLEKMRRVFVVQQGENPL